MNPPPILAVNVVCDPFEWVRCGFLVRGGVTGAAPSANFWQRMHAMHPSNFRTNTLVTTFLSQSPYNRSKLHLSLEISD